MKLLSINVGRPREIRWKGRVATSGIFKEPVVGRVKVHKLNLAGDRQADLSVHGGLNKAVYAYPAEHYEAWKKELPEMELPWGMFGENFTLTGLREAEVRLGDRLRIGSAEFVVTQPRMPCYKLGMKFKRNDIIRKFLRSGRTGFYLAVLKEGEVEAGDAIHRLGGEEGAPSIAEVVRQHALE
jgi:MOSC domain-containing protein YiiM